MIREYRDMDLGPLNTFGIAARCSRYVEYDGAEDLGRIFGRREIAVGRWAVLGGGSNILLTGDFDGTVIHPVDRSAAVTADDGVQVRVRAGAGLEWDALVEWCVDGGLWGAENLSYIPGLAGAAPVQNIGAYGVEAKDIIESVEVFDVKTCKTVTMAAAHCGFGYRDSVFKRELKGRAVITAVNLLLWRRPEPRLGYGDLRQRVADQENPTLRAIREAVTAIRREKLPEPAQTGNAGSFFKNPVVETELAEKLKNEYPDMPVYPAPQAGCSKLAAGWLIDRCGWKGRTLGRAGVHERQALVLVNRGGATGADVLVLAERIRADVRERFGVDIEMEVNVW